MRGLLASLNDHPMALLRGIAELRGLALSTNNRGEAAAQLATLLAEPDATLTAVTACSAAAQAAFSLLAAANGRMKAGVFSRAHGEIRPIGPGRLERELTWRQPESPAEELWYRGLIFRAFADFGEGPLEYIYIPEDLRVPPELRQPPTAAAPPIIAPVETPARAVRMLNTLAVDTCAVLAAFRETPPPVGKTERPQPVDGASLAAPGLPDLPALLITEADRLGLILALGRERGWIKTDRERLVLDTGAATAWLRRTHWEQMTSLYTTWRDSNTWNDLRRIPGLTTEGNWRNDPALARRGVLKALAALESSRWYAIADLVARLKAADPDFQRPDGDYSRWYLRDAETGEYLAGFESWDAVEGRLIRFLVTGPLFWLGAVALDAETGLQATCFRLTSLGTAWLFNRMPAELPRPARATAGDDFTVAAPLTLPLLDRYRLLRITEPDATSRYELGHPTRHRITRGSLARARSNNVKPEAIIEFLRRITGGKLSPRVVSALARWEEQSGAVHVSRGAILRVEDASVLAALRADPALAPLLGDLISAQAVLVREANLPRLLEVIRQSGYTLKLD